MKPYFRAAAPVALLFSVGFLAGCRKKEAPPAEAPPPAEVKVITATPTRAVMTMDQPGRMEAYRQAEVRARVSGIVTSRPYEEGQEVKAGTPLFIIDPAPLQAAFDAADAALTEAQANHALAIDKRERFDNLIAANAVSVREAREAASEEKQASARIASATAEKEMARLQLEYATVTSPIDGRARRAQVTEGALVGEGSATLLTTVEQIDPIYVNFSQPVADVMAMRQSVSKGQMEGVDPASLKVELVLGDGTVYGQPGKLLFADLAVDPGTDSVAMRAVFPNKDRQLLPGMYVRVKLDNAVRKDAILLPRVAVVRSGAGAQVMTVNAENKVVPVDIVANTMSGDQWLVTSGLTGGEKIIVENAGYMMPGSEVVPITGEATPQP